jgi:hypothetical protein
MPGQFEFDSQHKILLLVVTGEVDDARILASNEKIAAQVNRLHPWAGITDLSYATSFDVSSNAMRSAAKQNAPYPAETAWFIVAPQDHVSGMARMYELVGSQSRPNLKVVHTRQEASSALGIQNPKFDAVDSL